MAGRTYWLDLFTGATWQEFKDAGGDVSGFREKRWPTVQKIRPGDYLLCYVTGISRFIGVLEVVSEPFKAEDKIWSLDLFPCRMRVKPVIELEFETAVPVLSMRDTLSIFKDLSNPNAWTGRVRGSPARWSKSDGEAVLAALREAERHPVRKEFDPRKLKRLPKPIDSPIGRDVTVPESGSEPEPPVTAAEVPSEHTEIQALLLRLGAKMGFGLWVAQNDRNRECGGKKLSEFPKVHSRLPHQFDDATSKTIERIDVLWLEKKTIVAAFEIEYTTSIYSGLLRMSDLLAMKPNLSIPLYIVAPDERREKVFREVNRPTFSVLDSPLATVCRFVSFSSLRDGVSKHAAVLHCFKTDFLDELSESCDIDDA